jgi:hypothetical protein
MTASCIPCGTTTSGQSNDWRPDINYLPFAAAGAAGAAGAADDAGAATAAPDPPDFLAGFAGRLLPNEPLKIFPFLVFLSPLPIINFFDPSKLQKSPDTCTSMPGNGASRLAKP